MITWKLKDREAFQAIARKTMTETKKTEPETVLCEWFLSEGKGTVTLLEWFTGLAGAKTHLEGAEPRKFLPQLNDIGVVEAFHVYGNPDDDLRIMLAGLNPAGIHATAIDSEMFGFSRLVAEVPA